MAVEASRRNSHIEAESSTTRKRLQGAPPYAGKVSEPFRLRVVARRPDNTVWLGGNGNWA